MVVQYRVLTSVANDDWNNAKITQQCSKRKNQGNVKRAALMDARKRTHNTCLPEDNGINLRRREREERSRRGEKGKHMHSCTGFLSFGNCATINRMTLTKRQPNEPLLTIARRWIRQPVSIGVFQTDFTNQDCCLHKRITTRADRQAW